MASAFPSAAFTLEGALLAAQKTAALIKSQANIWLAMANADNWSAAQIIQIPAWLAAQNAVLTSCAAVSGLAAYAQANLQTQTPDVAASFAQMQAAVVATAQWIMANFPVDSSGYLQVQKFDANGNVVTTNFSSAQLAGLITQINALIATIA
jgi:hypothetical protein